MSFGTSSKNTKKGRRRGGKERVKGKDVGMKEGKSDWWEGWPVGGRERKGGRKE